MRTEEKRPDPDKLLASINMEEETRKRGKLKIFFGMSPGVGKTYTMLQTAHMDLSKGIDVVAGYIESHNRPETNALLEKIETIPRKRIEYKGTILEEMDLDAVILRHPYLVLVDELAHTNAIGSRHVKRYQDVLELLDNGINVYTTVNIQHLESRNDTVAQITGVIVRETLPDEIFEMADDVELIDITPNTLLERLAEGKVYAPEQSKEAIQNFFRKGNITALREMALRLVADRVDKQLKAYMQQKRIEGPWKSGMHLLVLVGPSKSSAKLIRWAKNLSYTMGANLVALHVENTQVLNDAQQEQLSKNIDLARQFGAEVIITSGNDLVSTTLDIAHRENITHIIIGKSGKQSFFSALFSKDNFVNRLLKESGEIDIYVIEPGFEAKQYKRKLYSYPDFSSSYKKYIFAGLVVLVTVLLCLPVSAKTGYQSVSFIMLFVVLILSMFLRLGPVMLASAISAILWNFFFIPPQYTIKITQPEDILAFCMFFIVALVTGSLTSKVRKQERLTRKREEKTNSLFHLTNQLASADNSRSIIEIAKEDIWKYFAIETFFFLQDENGKLKNKDITSELKNFSDSEYSIAQWVFKHSKKAGKYTDTLSSSEYTFYPLKGIRTNPGVVAVKLNKKFNGETELFWDTFLIQISNTLEHHYFAELAKKANLLDESDKLYKALFNSISHELRIPVATIMGASDTLLTNTYPEDVKKELYGEILIASNRLNRLIENLLNISRLETGKIAPRIDWCDISDLFNQVVENLQEELNNYKLDIVVPPSMPLVKLDFGLMEQALHNLVYNSCKYSQAGTTIRLKTFYDNEHLIIQEMDRGPGFPPDTLSFVFNKFYRAGNMATGGLGLGLSITKGFIEAHKGSINVENRQNGGARFTIKIPTEISYTNNLDQTVYE
ncbi:sensor histidine kinase KdpD [Dysgonomonas sp. Marseille-P4677]|uniref:sensor histidine kinase n=1 Tax=Dysgonomonas sp. Marseille-P4677 TaxID=2364790 RepID=UPI00191166E6|nr:sensor histidine kinase KdpD [Dysgonomonas sp. Marseille-P4677]MBK5722237.1 sensor histidine kinase KdpD [Dysgonomonas sp. Marseille-P4677]